MGFEFRPAVRESVGLLTGLAGGTGSGKTFSAMRLATGMSGNKRFCVIDTENGRAKFYADSFAFDHGLLREPFTPERYIEAIEAADKAEYPVIVVDSASHVWSGDGGVLDMQEAELSRMAGDDWKKRESCKMASWIKPKQAHKRFVAALLKTKAHVILCFRAEEKIEIVKDGGKTKVQPKSGGMSHNGWTPICDSRLPFECTTFLLLLHDKPGVPVPITLREPHRPLVKLNEPLTEDVGKALSSWAAGGKAPPKATATKTKTVSDLQAEEIDRLFSIKQVNVAKVLGSCGADSITQIPSEKYERLVEWLNEQPDK